MYKLPFVAIFLLWAFIPLVLFGKGDTLRYAMTQYTNDNGLPQNSVKSIAVDNLGFIWLGTESGAVRFDGKNFKLFNKRNTGMNTSRIVSIETNHVDGGLYALNDSWQMLQLSEGKAKFHPENVKENFRALHPSMGHKSFVATTWKSGDFVDVYGRDSLQRNIDSHRSVLLINDGNLIWYRHKKEIARQSLGMPLDLFSTFTLDSNVYVFPRKPLAPILRVCPSGSKPIQLTGAILRQKDIKQWVLCGNTTTDELFIYADQHFYAVQVNQQGHWHTKLLLTGFDFIKEQIISGHYDHAAERLYLGSGYNGLFVFKRQRFSVHLVDSLAGINNIFYEIIPFGWDAILSGRGVKLSANDTPPKVYSSLKQTRNSFGNAILKTREGHLWTANSDWLCKRKPTVDEVLDKWYMPYAYSLTEAADGTIWIGTNKQGIFRLNPKQAHAMPELWLNSDEYILCISPEGHDVLWAGTEGHLYRIDLSSRKASAIPALDNKIVRSLYIPKPGEVWACTYEDGLFLIQGNKLTHFPLDNKGYMNTVHRIVEDRKGYFWMSTNNGLFKARKADLLRYAAQTASSVFYQYFSKADGFNTNEFNGGSNQVAAALDNGMLAFSSMDGVVMFDPYTIKDDLPTQDIVIDELMVDGSLTQYTDTLVLQQKAYRIAASIVTPYFGNHNNLQFEYKLGGESLDQQWVKLDNPYLLFLSLPAGQHIIHIRKKAGYGTHNYTLKQFVIIVPLSWWETPWFKVLGIVLFLLLVGIIVNVRLRYLRQRTVDLQNIVKLRTTALGDIIGRLELSQDVLSKELNYQKRINQSVAHDIHTPLRYLTIATRYLAQKTANKEEIADDEMNRIHEGAQKIYEYADMLVTYMKSRLQNDALVPQKVGLHILVKNLKVIFRNAMAEKKNQFVNKVAPELTVHIHPQLLEILLHNLIDNAIKNTASGQIIFTAEDNSGWTVLSVTDTGRGISPVQVLQLQQFLQDGKIVQENTVGLGMKMVYDIVLLLKAKLTVESELGFGTTFRLSLPKSSAKVG